MLPRLLEIEKDPQTGGIETEITTMANEENDNLT